jgi:asparagine synthetase B (glutamine-hydrolysing)
MPVIQPLGPLRPKCSPSYYGNLMLLIALSRLNLPGQFTSLSCQQFRVAGGWVLTIVTDGLLSSVAALDDEILGVESPLCSTITSSDPPFITARFSSQERNLEIFKTTLSGRPVYYHLSASGEFFASTHISLLRKAGVGIQEDTNAVPELLIYRTVAPPRTLYRGIAQLSFSGRICVQLGEDGCALTVEDGYLPSDEPGSNTDETQIVKRVTELLSDCVGKLKPIAERVTTLLSGGMDSSILSTLVSQQLGSLDTYSSAYPFEDPARDLEKTYALSAAAGLATRHRVFVPNTLDFVLGTIEALHIAETPLDHLQSVLLHLLFKHAIPTHLDRVIHGAAAESPWGTDAHLLFCRRSTLRQRLLSIEPLRLTLRMIGAFWPKALEVNGDVDTVNRLRLPLSNPQSALWAVGAYGDHEWVKSYCGVSDEDIIKHRYQSLRSLADRPLNDVLALYSLNFQVAANVALWSKLGEGHHKILYYPYASEQLINFAFSVPWRLKLKSPKHLLRLAGRRLGVPEEILNRPKRSFGTTSQLWAEEGGALEPLIPIAAKVVDIDALRSLQRGESRPAMSLWSLLNYAVLKRLFILGEPVDILVDELLENDRRLQSGVAVAS